MASEQERCAEGRRFEQIDDAFRNGDLEQLRAAVDGSSLVPKGAMPHPIGICLVCDGFPPLIAALSCASDMAGTMRRADLHDVLRLLLTFGADPNQRGINDCTPLHIGRRAGRPDIEDMLVRKASKACE